MNHFWSLTVNIAPLRYALLCLLERDIWNDLFCFSYIYFNPSFLGIETPLPNPDPVDRFDYVCHDTYHHPKLLPSFEAPAVIFWCIVASQAHTHPCTHTHARARAHTHTHVHTRAPTYTHTCARAHTHTHVHTHTHPQHTHTRPRAHTHKRVHTHTRTHVHTHTQYPVVLHTRRMIVVFKWWTHNAAHFQHTFNAFRSAVV
jgi:hypothetical protein